MVRKRGEAVLSETLAEGLHRYRIGPKIRALRQGKKLGLAQLGAHTGLSSGMLSKIERGQLIPTLPTLLRIAMVFGLELDFFFADRDEGPKVAVVRREERLRLPDNPGAMEPAYLFESLDFPMPERKMQGFFAAFVGEMDSAPHSHPGEELVYLIAGELRLTVAGRENLLRTGDAIHFESAWPHSYRRNGPGPCTGVIVVSTG
jgi:transcriptional regulator with XRE-family HTH domain